MEKLNSVFFYHLEKAIKTYRQFAQNQLKAKGIRITIDQWLVLKALTDSPDITQNELAEVVFKDKASIARIIELLVKNGYIRRDSHSESRRRNKLTLTEKGNKLIKELIPIVLKNRKTGLKNIEVQEIINAEKVLQTIITNCSK